MKTTGNLRAELAKCFELAKNGELAGDALRGVVGCANQINSSLAIEMKARAQLIKEQGSAEAIGEMRLGAQEN